MAMRPLTSKIEKVKIDLGATQAGANSQSRSEPTPFAQTGSVVASKRCSLSRYHEGLGATRQTRDAYKTRDVYKKGPAEVRPGRGAQRAGLKGGRPARKDNNCAKGDFVP
jgi:hypothetical protein